MKKILSIILSVCMLFSLSALIVSCSHDCAFSEDWTKNATDHWHACTHDGCTEPSDKAAHEWDEGKITTKATQEAEGVKTFTCTVCGQTKTEGVAFTGLSVEDWTLALADFAFENCTYEESASTGSGALSSRSITYKFNKDKAWIKNRVGTPYNKTIDDPDEVEELRSALADSLRELLPYKSFAYDAETKTYKATERIYISALKDSTRDMTLKFENGKLAEITYSLKMYSSNTSYTVTATVKITDYGTTVINGL